MVDDIYNLISSSGEDSSLSTSSSFLFFSPAVSSLTPFDANYTLLESMTTTDGTTTATTVAGNGATTLPMVYYGDVWTSDVIQRVVTLVLLMIATLLGNTIIIIVLTCSKYRNVNSRVNIFIVNLALGDLTVCCVTMTTEVLFVAFDKAWVLGFAACKLLLYAQIVTLASTTFILTAMSFDRYLAICRPLSNFGGIGVGEFSRPKLMIVISWIMALVFAIPQLLIFRQESVGIYPDGTIKYRCKSAGYTPGAWWQRKAYFTFLTSYILVIPAVIISYCYMNVVRIVWRQGHEITHTWGAGGGGTTTTTTSTTTTTGSGSIGGGITLRRTIKDSSYLTRAKIKTIKMTLSIICSFIACWTPYFVVHNIHIWSEYTRKVPDSVYALVETLALLNSALNPILYGCFNIQLKRGLTEVCCPRRIRDSERQSRALLHSGGGRTGAGGLNVGDCRGVRGSVTDRRMFPPPSPSGSSRGGINGDTPVGILPTTKQTRYARSSMNSSGGSGGSRQSSRSAGEGASDELHHDGIELIAVHGSHNKTGCILVTGSSGVGCGDTDMDCPGGGGMGGTGCVVRDHFLREENQRGFKLRVRFVPSKQSSLDGRMSATNNVHMLCTSDAGNGKSLPTDINYTTGSSKREPVFMGRQWRFLQALTTRPR